MSEKPRPSPKSRSAKPKTRSPLAKIDGFFRRSGKSIITLTVKEVLDEAVATEPGPFETLML